jgi:Endonuclease/Exonuclease/phosphatase family
LVAWSVTAPLFVGTDGNRITRGTLQYRVLRAFRRAGGPSGTHHLRGIDVSPAYDDRKLTVVEAHSHVVHLRYATRDIFEVVFETTDTHHRLVVIASHWPSRRLGRLASEASRTAVAENIAYLVCDHLRFTAQDHLNRIAADDIQAVQDKFDTLLLIVGDFNDEPGDASVDEHLLASSELGRVVGSTDPSTDGDSVQRGSPAGTSCPPPFPRCRSAPSCRARLHHADEPPHASCASKVTPSSAISMHGNTRAGLAPLTRMSSLYEHP